MTKADIVERLRWTPAQECPLALMADAADTIEKHRAAVVELREELANLRHDYDRRAAIADQYLNESMALRAAIAATDANVERVRLAIQPETHFYGPDVIRAILAAIGETAEG